MTDQQKQTKSQFIRFLVVGGSGTIVNLIIYSLYVLTLGKDSYMMAATAAFAVAVVWNYYWNRAWTFKHGGREGVGSQFFEFLTVSLFAYAINLGVLKSLVLVFNNQLDYQRLATAFGIKLETVKMFILLFAQGFGIAVGTIFNFAGSKIWVFSDTREVANRKLKYLGVVSAAVIIALVLRFNDLSKESIWLDEAASIHFASSLDTALEAEATNPPLYYTMLHFWMRLFGTSEIAVRSLSIPPSVIAIILVYLLGRRLFSEEAGALAAAFMAVSTFQIYYAQEARGFAWLLCFTLGSSLMMEKILAQEGRGKLLSFVDYLLLTLAALYTHFYAVFFVIGQNLFFVLDWRKNREKLWRWAAIQIAIIGAFLPLIIGTLKAAGIPTQQRQYLILKFPQTLFNFLAGETLVPMNQAAVENISHTFRSYGAIFAVAAIAFGIITIAAFAAAKQYRRGFAFFIALGIVPMAIPFVISFRRMIFDERYPIAATAAIYLFLAAGFLAAMHFKNKAFRLSVVAAGAIVAILSAVALNNYYFDPRFGKEEWRETVAYVEQNTKPGDLVLFDAGYVIHPYEYYSRKTDITLMRIKDLSIDENSPEWLEIVLATAGRDHVWLVRSHSISDKMFDRLREKFTAKKCAAFTRAKRIDVYLLERK